MTWSGVLFSDVVFKRDAIFPTSVSIPIPVTTNFPLPYVTKLPENVVRVLVEGIDRARLNGFLDKEERYLVSEIEVVKSPLHLNEGRYGRSMEGTDIEEEAMIRNLRELFLEFCSFFPRIGKTMLKHFEGTFSLGVLMDELIESMPVTFDKNRRYWKRLS